MIDRCKQLATADDPLPEWLPAFEEALAERLAKVDVAPIDFVVEPAGAQVELSVSSFAPDEQFRPRTIHLPLGAHHVVATAPGYVRADRTIDVTGKHPQRVVIQLQPVQLATTPPPPPPRATSKVPLVVMAAGGALIAAGAVYHATAFRTAANKLADATDETPDPALYDAWSHRFDVRREALIAMYAAGAVTLGIGVVLQLTSRGRSERDVQVSVAPTPGGGLVSLGWSR
jgi:hypothetical protein